MAGFYQTFARTPPTADGSALLSALRALDASTGISVSPDGTTVIVKKNTDWTNPQITAAQNVVDTAPALTLQRHAQNTLDAMPIFEKAIILALVDQLNVIRSKLSPALPAITVQQAIDAVRTKAGNL